MSKKIVLRNEQNAKGSRLLTASLTPEGDLLIEGCDRGVGVAEIFGEGNDVYEWIWTIRQATIPSLVDALNERRDLSVLDILKKRFSGEMAAEIQEFLESNRIPHEFWNRINE